MKKLFVLSPIVCMALDEALRWAENNGSTQVHPYVYEVLFCIAIVGLLFDGFLALNWIMQAKERFMNKEPIINFKLKVPPKFAAWVFAGIIFAGVSMSWYYVGQKAGYNTGYSDGKEYGYTAGYEAAKQYWYGAGYSAGTKSNVVDIPSTSQQHESYLIYVYVTESGTKYHQSGCQYLSQSCIKMELSKALSKGYTACSKCW